MIAHTRQFSHTTKKKKVVAFRHPHNTTHNTTHNTQHTTQGRGRGRGEGEERERRGEEGDGVERR